MKRLLLVAAAALAGISLFLLTSASANTELFATSYPYLLALNGAMVVVLGALSACSSASSGANIGRVSSAPGSSSVSCCCSR